MNQSKAVASLCKGYLAKVPPFALSRHNNGKRTSNVDTALSGGARLSHCAVVGSSAAAVYCDWVSAIDNTPYIIRANMQPAQMFSDIVGNRTDIQLRYSLHKNKDLGHCAYKYKDERSVVHAFDMCTGEGGGWGVSIHNAAYEAKKVRMDSSGDRRRYIYNKDFSRASDLCARHYGPVGGSSSSGIRAVMLALTICERIDVYNFWAYDHVTIEETRVPIDYSFYTGLGHGRGSKSDKSTGKWVGFHNFVSELETIKTLSTLSGIDMTVHLPTDTECSLASGNNKRRLKQRLP
jgi:glycosyl transferase family 29 (putative sialyltransferase)